MSRLRNYLLDAQRREREKRPDFHTDLCICDLCEGVRYLDSVERKTCEPGFLSELEHRIELRRRSNEKIWTETGHPISLHRWSAPFATKEDADLAVALLRHADQIASFMRGAVRELDGLRTPGRR